ncbi:MAG: hypothetical protein QOK42_1781 [Frankiaceae bacterium]|nr:hypothetical protein [Frankiaceae bacterium]
MPLGSRPVGAQARRLAGPLVLAEGAALLLLCAGYAVSLLVGHPHNRGLALFGALLGGGFGAALVLGGRALRQGKRWAWTPSFLAQLLAVPVGIGLVQGGHGEYGVVVLAPALVTGVLLLAGAPRPD